MGITLDGYASANGGSGGATTGSGSVTFSNTNAGDVVEIVILASGSAAMTVSAVTSPHVTWTRRESLSPPAMSAHYVLEKWYGVAAAKLTAEVVSFTFSSAVVGDWAAFVRGWSGADTATVYDTNASLPATNTSTSSSTLNQPTVSGVSTTSPNVALTCDCGNDGFNNFNTSANFPSGFTACGTAPNGFINSGAADNGADCVGLYQIESAVQTNLTLTFANNMFQWAIMADAIRAAPVPGLGAHSQVVSAGF